MMLEEFDLKNSNITSNSHLRNIILGKRKTKGLKLQSKKQEFFRHQEFDTVFWHPNQKQFLYNFLNYFENYIEDFIKIKKSKKQNKSSQDSSNLETINKISKEKTQLQEFVETNKNEIYKVFINKFKQELSPFKYFYSKKKEDKSVPYQSIPTKEDISNNLYFVNNPLRLIKQSSKGEWASVKNKEVIMVECQNEKIFEKGKSVIPVSINGLVSKREKKIYKGIEKKNYPQFSFLLHESDFLFISLSMNDLMIRIILYFWEFIMDFEKILMDVKFLKQILGKIKDKKKLFLDSIIFICKSKIFYYNNKKD